MALKDTVFHINCVTSGCKFHDSSQSSRTLMGIARNHVAEEPDHRVRMTGITYEEITMIYLDSEENGNAESQA